MTRGGGGGRARSLQAAVGSPDFLGHFQVSGVQVSFPGVGLNIQGAQHRSGGGGDRDTACREDILPSRLLARRVVFFLQKNSDLYQDRRENASLLLGCVTYFKKGARRFRAEKKTHRT